MFSPEAVNTPAPGVRMAEPSSSVKEPVPITCPEVGTPTSLPRPSARKPSGNISASLAERSRCSRTASAREHLGIARGALVLQHHHGAEEGGARALDVQRIAPARHLVGFALVENLQQFLV